MADNTPNPPAPAPNSATSPAPTQAAAPRPAPEPRPMTTSDTAGPDTDRQDTVDELPEARPTIGFWQQPWVQNILPFATSFIIHAAIIVVGLLLVTQIEEVYKVVREQIIIPDATMIEGADIGGIPNPGLGEDPNRASAQDADANIPPDATGLSNTRVQQLNQSLMGGGSEAAGTNPLAIGPNAGAKGKGGKGMGDGETGGGMSPFGIPGGGGGVGPKSKFMGTSGNATRIIFICDASGSMGTKFDILKDQLRRSVDSLKPVQGFNIIFFNNNVAYPLNANDLVMANPEGKRKAYEFLNSVVPGPDSNPLPAIAVAFKLKPELIYFLTDGDFQFDLNANDKVLDTLRDLNKDGKTKINTIAFVNADEKGQLSTGSSGFVDLLKKIAAAHGGIFKMAAADEF